MIKTSSCQTNSRLSADEELQTVTVSEFLSAHRRGAVLKSCIPSWAASLTRWIGSAGKQALVCCLMPAVNWIGRGRVP